jgi:hypothetical protein
MKPTQEEQIKEIKAVAKSIKKDGVKVTKAELGEMYVYHTTYLLKALAKAQKPSV